MELVDLIVIVSIVVAIALIDYFLYLKYGYNGTISDYLRSTTTRWRLLAYVIVYAFGCLTGHWFLCPAPCGN